MVLERSKRGSTLRPQCVCGRVCAGCPPGHAAEACIERACEDIRPRGQSISCLSPSRVLARRGLLVSSLLLGASPALLRLSCVLPASGPATLLVDLFVINTKHCLERKQYSSDRLFLVPIERALMGMTRIRVPARGDVVSNATDVI